MVIWKGWFETVPCRVSLATPSPALCPRILGTRFTHYGLRMFWGELMVFANAPTCYRAPEPRNPKVHFKVRKMPFSTPRKNGIFSDFKMHFWGFGVPGLCSRSGVCNNGDLKRVIWDCSLQSGSEHPIFSPLSKNSRNTVYKSRFASLRHKANPRGINFA